MSVFSSYAAQISGRQATSRKSQFRAGKPAGACQFVSCKGVGAKRHIASIMRPTGGRMQQPVRSLVAILVTIVLCDAFALRAEAAAPSAETIARGEALVIAGDCAGCHTSDPAKPFAGGGRI